VSHRIAGVHKYYNKNVLLLMKIKTEGLSPLLCLTATFCRFIIGILTDIQVTVVNQSMALRHMTQS
jgi:hypothetical protein